MSKVVPEEEKKPDLGKPKQYDPNFKGPTKNRSCTDIICCLLFLIFIGVLGLISAYAYVNGDPLLLLYPVDSDGKLCGYGDNAGKDYLFYFDLIGCAQSGMAVFITGCPSPMICVASCPSYHYSFLTDATQSSQLKYCKPSADLSKSVAELISDDSCPAYFFSSTPVINRCVPEILVDVLSNAGTLDSSSVSKTMSDKSGSALTDGAINAALDVYGAYIRAKEVADKIMSDIIQTWWITLLFMIAIMLFSLLWIVLMRFLAGVMVWLTILAFLGGFGFAAVYGITYYLNGTNGTEEFSIDLSIFVIKYSYSKLYLALGITAALIFAIVLVMVVFLFKRIKIAIALIKETSRAIGTMVTSLAFPIFPMFLQVLLAGYFIVLGAFLASTGRATTAIQNTTETWSNGEWNTAAITSQVSGLMGTSCEGTNASSSNTCAYLTNVEENFVIYAAFFSLFMFFWLLNFIIALGQMTLAGAFASYYWAFVKPKDLPAFPIGSALWRCFRYHLGTLAFGSLIIALVQIVRVILEYLDHKLNGSENPAAKFFVKCLKCCFWCMEKCMKFLTKNAYIMCAIHGKNFCLSAKDAFFAIMRNIVRVAVVDKVTDFILFVGKLVIVGVSGAGAMMFYSSAVELVLTTYDTSVSSYIAPILIVVFIAYAIASCFFSVFGMGVNTLFMCFLEDLERNDGSNEKPYFMNKDLMGILGLKNKIIQEKQKKGVAPGSEF